MTALRGLVPIETVQKRLRERADSYGRDAVMLRNEGSPRDGAMFETVRDELRRIADELMPAPIAEAPA